MFATNSSLGLSVSLASSGYSQSVDFDLVDEIIGRAPRNSTAFPLVYQTYQEVLSEHGLSPATDTTYYQFLLKLQVIRASSWQEKWQLWKSSLQADIQPLQKASPKVPRSTKLEAVRARVPFLASASSDLDDAFGEEEAVNSVYNEGASVIEILRPSPRKALSQSNTSRRRGINERDEHSRSLVGYTPSGSIDLAYGHSLEIPARTSTPVYAQQNLISPMATPPPYSVSISDQSEVSGSIGLISQDDSQLIDGLSTPKARKKAWSEQRILKDEVVREMERRADQFYETGLMGRCLDVWVQSHEWIKTTTAQIDTVRDNVLLRQCLHKWQSATERVLDLPNTADAHRRQHLQSRVLKRWIRKTKSKSLEGRENAFIIAQEEESKRKSWRKWRMELVQKRTGRWEKDMRIREKRFVRDREEVLVRDVFDRWRGETRTKVDTHIADSNARRKLLTKVFNSWRYRVEQKERLDGQLAMWDISGDKRLKHETLSRWVQESRLVRAEVIWEEKRDKAVVGAVWERWILVKKQNDQADGFLRHRLLGDALARWKAARESKQVLRKQAISFALLKDRESAKHALNMWKASARGNLLVRVVEQRLLKNKLQRWKSRLSEVSGLEARLVMFETAQRKALLGKAFQVWHRRYTAQQSALQEASQALTLKLKSSAFRRWREASKKVVTDRAKAEKASEFFIQRQIFGVWKAQLAVKRQERWEVEKTRSLLRAVLDRWRKETTISLEGKRLADSFRAKSDQSLVSACLTTWTNRVIFLKSRQLDASEARDKKLIQRSLGNWIKQSKRIRDITALSESFYDIKSEDRLKQILRSWREMTNRKVSIRIAKEKLQKERLGRLVRDAWDLWRERTAEKRLKEIEMEVASRHEDAIIFAVWDNWKLQTSVLPAISFDNARIKRRAFTAMLVAMQRSKAAKDFGGPRDRHLLEDTFIIWRTKTVQKLKSRTGRTRGRIRPSQTPSAARQSLPSVTSDTQPRSAPRRSFNAIHSRRHSLHKSRSGSPHREYAESVVSEPAYDRLKSELSRGRIKDEGQEERGKGRSPVIAALRGLGR